MSHDKDIHGNAWAPCGGCPHPIPGSCPSRAHRAFCDRLARDYEAWAPRIAAMPPEDRPSREVAISRPPSPSPPRSCEVLFVHADMGHARGLSVNSELSVAALSRLGIRAASWAYRDVAEIVPAVRGLPALKLVVLQGGRYDPATLAAITDDRPSVTWWLRCHSNPAFLAVEPGTIGEMRRFHALAAERPNLRLAGVSSRFTADWQGAYGGEVLCLPNLYPMPTAPPPARPIRDDGPLVLGCFGAARLQKHGTVAAVAAAIVARRTGRPVTYRIHGAPGHPGAGSVVDAITAFLTDVPGITLELLPWISHDAFLRDHLSTLDMHLQPSASETYNITVADAAALGIPSVVGPAIEWMPADMCAPVDDAAAVADAAMRLLADPTAGRRAYDALAAHAERAQAAWLAALAATGVGPRPARATAQPGGDPLAVLLTAKACDYRVPLDPLEASSCGCNGKALAYCLAGKATHHDGRVTLSECLACIKAR